MSKRDPSSPAPKSIKKGELIEVNSSISSDEESVTQSIRLNSDTNDDNK